MTQGALNWVGTTHGNMLGTETTVASTGTKVQEFNRKKTLTGHLKSNKYCSDWLIEQQNIKGKAGHLTKVCSLAVLVAAVSLHMFPLPLLQSSTHQDTKRKWQRGCRQDVRVTSGVWGKTSALWILHFQGIVYPFQQVHSGLVIRCPKDHSNLLI